MKKGNKEKFYITTTLPYVNADPHIGFAAEIVRADCIARYKRQLGYDVFFNTGTDEHGLKIHRKAEENGIDTQEYCDKYAGKFDDLKDALNLSYDNFIRTTDKIHEEAAQDFWKKCEKNGDIYKKNYKVKYCVGCELEKTESELVNGECPYHPGKELELIEEENYFFRWSKYGDKLLKMYKDNPNFILPKHRMNEISNFIEGGLQDFSISRLKEKMPWGIGVPGDKNHVMYVWFDALTNYINCLGWNKNDKRFEEFWPGMQVAGKDNLRQQTAMWQAMLMSAGIPNSTQVLIFGFINVDGQKMSKSIGNVVNPLELVEKYGTDATRYYLLSALKPFEDSDFTYEKFETKYNADLANGLGNLVARTSNMLEKNNIALSLNKKGDSTLKTKFEEKFNNFLFDESLEILWSELRSCDEFLSEKAPWKMKEVKEIEAVLKVVAQKILNVAILLNPFLPEVSDSITKQFSEKFVKKEKPLFPRI
jgi:methionyl-tRNA synthetase